MQALVALFVVLVGAIELFHWIEGMMLPLPMLVAAGVLLAIASNKDKKAGLPWAASDAAKNLPPQPPANSQQLPTAPVASSATDSNSQQKRSPELPQFDTRSAQQQISFTIRKSAPRSTNEPQ